jgi:hypothetical protein
MRAFIDIALIADELSITPETVEKWIKKGIIIEAYAPKGTTKRRIAAEIISEPTASRVDVSCNFYFTLRSVREEIEELDITGAKILKFRPLKTAKTKEK